MISGEMGLDYAVSRKQGEQIWTDRFEPSLIKGGAAHVRHKVGKCKHFRGITQEIEEALEFDHKSCFHIKFIIR